MSLLTMVKSVARQCGEDASEISTIEGLSDSLGDDWKIRIIDYINEGYELAWNKAFKNPQTDTSGTWTIDTAPYNIATKGINEIISLSISGYKPLVSVEFKEFQQTYIDFNPGRPEYYSTFQNKLYFNTTLDQSYTLNYFAKASFTELDEDTDEPLIKKAVLINYARYKYLTHQGDFQGAQTAYNDYITSIRDFIDNSYMQGSPAPFILPEDAFLP